MEHVKVTFGKYINNLATEIPSEHIILEDFGTINRSVEPGEPNIPTVEELSFKLANLDPQGNQRYSRAYWEAQARTEAEGAYQPLQLYFLVEVDGERQFLGMLKGLAYSKYNATCEIKVSDVMDIFKDSDKNLLTSFQFQTKCVFTRTSGNSHPHTDGNDLDNAKSLDAEDIAHASHMFGLDFNDDPDEVLTSEIAVHLGWDNNDFTTYREIERSAWVQVNDITLLTHVRFFQKRDTSNFLGIDVWHNHEEQTVIGDFPELNLIYQRGQYLDGNGDKLESGTGGVDVTLTLHEPDLGNGTPSLLHIDDTPLNQNWIFGVPYTVETGYIQISSASYCYFDVLDLITSAAEDEINNVHSDSGESYITLFDSSRVTSLHRKAFWADIAMTGLAEYTLSEALVAVARQTSSWLYTDRFGKVVVHSRNYSDDVLTGSAFSKDVLNIDWEPLNGIDYDHGFTTYQTEVPFDIIEINNLISEKTQKLISDSIGLKSQAALRNKKVKLSNYRLTNLAVPQPPNPYAMPVLRYSPDDASWPHADTLENFLPTPAQQLRLIAESFAWPTAITRIGLPHTYSNVDDGGTPKALDYLKDENDQIWWVREETLDPDTLKVECEIQLIGNYNAGGSGSGSGGS